MMIRETINGNPLKYIQRKNPTMTPQSGMDPIHIVLSSHDAFAGPFRVMLASLFENCSDRERINVTILDGGLVPENRKNIAEKYNAMLLPVIKDRFVCMVTGGHINTMTCFWQAPHNPCIVPFTGSAKPLCYSNVHQQKKNVQGILQ
jgi:hypothetical protein